MGPYEFVKYRGKENTFATVKNILNQKEFSVTTSHIIPFTAELSPALLSQAHRLAEHLKFRAPLPRGRPRGKAKHVITSDIMSDEEIITP